MTNYIQFLKTVLNVHYIENVSSQDLKFMEEQKYIFNSGSH